MRGPQQKKFLSLDRLSGEPEINVSPIDYLSIHLFIFFNLSILVLGLPGRHFNSLLTFNKPVTMFYVMYLTGKDLILFILLVNG